MKIKHLFLLISCLSVQPALAGDDFGLWTEAAVQKDINKKISVDAALEFRADDKVRQASRWAVSTGISYKPVKYLSIGSGYVFIHDYSSQETKVDYKRDDDTGLPELDDEGLPEFNGYNVDHAYWRNRHRALIEVSGKFEVARFTFSLRERYQYTRYLSATTLRDKYRKPLPAGMTPEDYTGDIYEYAGQYFTRYEQVEDSKQAKEKHYLRSRLQVKYNINHCPWSPYVSYEFSNNLKERFDLDKTRLTVGAEWKITKKHRLNLAYLYENGADDDADNNHHVVSVGYKFKF